MIKNILFSFCVIGVLVPCSSQVIENGQCNLNVPTVTNFNIDEYTGRWNLIESYPSDFQSGTCNDATYSLSGTLVNVFNTQVISRSLSTITGTATLASTDGSAKLFVDFPSTNELSDYWVVATDYQSYALVYSCRNINSEQKRVWSWKLSRTNELTDAATNAINQVIEAVDDLQNNNYYVVDRSESGCFYYPEPNEVSVIFRGQCDENIPVVHNFDAERYLGKWHLIESYPNDRTGSCNEATYSVDSSSDGRTILVYNTEVFNQTLRSINGTATIISNDGSAKLLVNVGSPEPGNYWVLDTDYESYSFIYSCKNINNEEKRVWSWKMSRTNELTPAATNAINQVINNFDVLDNRYYYTIDRSYGGCFYYPEPDGVAVVFRGQCDETIPVVLNFDAARHPAKITDLISNLFYVTGAQLDEDAGKGRWRMIESYPSNFQSGTCNDATYSLDSDGGTVLVYNTQVIDQTSRTINGTATFATTDGSAKLLVSFPSTTEFSNYWVLDTDYDSYALIYSCRNINREKKRVWSWKLSRTEELSPAATSAINEVINSIDVLDNRYYYSVDRSYNGCFYYPEPNGVSVVFRGQCDESVPVVSNFDGGRYQGKWNMIESYPSDHQSGTCNDATYTLDDDTVLVYNTQVIDETLRTINGTVVFANIDGSAKLLVNFPSTNNVADYWVLDTDYDSYALVYSCRNLNNEEKRVWSWKLSRTNTLTVAAATAIDQVINRIDVLDSRYFYTVERSDDSCFYYPKSDGSLVVLRGQCDENMPVVPNFDVEKYLGVWYDIESYPTFFQKGSCPTATYTLGSEGVVVYNTEVIDGNLDYIYGSAVLATDNGDAKLIVSFPVAGGNLTTYSNYWVLATDYDTYSLVYSCTNLDQEYRRVGAWKLGRQRTMPASSNAAINEVMATRKELHQPYFLRREQNDDCDSFQLFTIN